MSRAAPRRADPHPASPVPTRRDAAARLAGPVAFAVATAWFLLVELARYRSGRATSYDLGIFSQAAQAWSRGELPRSPIRGPHTLLADHFSPVTALFGAVWRVWPDPVALLVLQAVLLGLGVALLVDLAARRLGLWPAAVALVSALLGRTLLAGARFDVHEVAFAVPLVAWLCRALLARRLVPALLAGVGLVLVKEDLGLTVAAAGVVSWWLHRDEGRTWESAPPDGSAGPDVPSPRRSPWPGALALVGLGVAGLALAMLVVAHFNGGGSAYLDYLTGGSGGALSQHSAPPTHGLHLGRRVMPLVGLTLAALVVGWRSPLMLLAAPTLAWRLVSSNASYWSLDFHYDLVLWPVAAAAFVHAWPSVRERRWARPVVALVLAGVVAGGLNLLVVKEIDPFDQRRAPVLARLDEVMRTVPRGSVVAAQNDLGPYLLGRYEVRMLGVGRTEPVRYVVLTDDTARVFQAPACARADLLRRAAAQGLRTARSGSVVRIDLGSTRPVPLADCEPR